MLLKYPVVNVLNTSPARLHTDILVSINDSVPGVTIADRVDAIYKFYCKHYNKMTLELIGEDIKEMVDSAVKEALDGR